MVEPAADKVRERLTEKVRGGARERKPLADHQALYNGFGNALAQAVEFVGAPIIFFLVGLWLDHKLGTGHLFAIVLFVLAIVGTSVTAYYRYKASMDQEEEGKPWKRT